MGVSAPRARGSIRFSLSIENTAEDVDYLLQQLPRVLRKLQALLG